MNSLRHQDSLQQHSILGVLNVLLPYHPYHLARCITLQGQGKEAVHKSQNAMNDRKYSVSIAAMSSELESACSTC